MSVVPELLANNERYAVGFPHGELPRPPRRPLAIVTCLDGRIDLHAIFGLGIGEANVIRNAGGRAADALRSLIISQHLLGTREIIVMHHTDCGSRSFSAEEIRQRVAENLGPDAGEQAEAIDFLSLPDLEDSLRADVELLRASPLLFPETIVTGLIYDVHTGRLRVVGEG
jgi:carbonic anhydrase